MTCLTCPYENTLIASLNFHRKAGLQATDQWRRPSKHRGTGVHCNLSTSQHCKFPLHLEEFWVPEMSEVSEMSEMSKPIHVAFLLVCTNYVCETLLASTAAKATLDVVEGDVRDSPPPQVSCNQKSSIGYRVANGLLIFAGYRSILCITLVLSIQYQLLWYMKALPPLTLLTWILILHMLVGRPWRANGAALESFFGIFRKLKCSIHRTKDYCQINLKTYIHANEPKNLYTC